MTAPPKHFPASAVLILVVLIGMINGLLFVFIVPPWQHYDEPNHFEYTWWIANHGGIPTSTDVDTGMRREVASSMIEHHFFDQLNFLPDLSAEGKDIWIGQYSQVNDPPLYYAIVALPLRLFSDANVTTQLYVGRIVSWLFFLLTIVGAYGLAAELSPPGHLLRFLLPFTVAILPGFVDLMTAINNDVGLVLFFSWFTWAVVRLVGRGFNWIDFIWAVISSALAILTKQTGLLTLPIFALGVLFSLAPGRQRRCVWFLLLGLSVAGIVAVFSWGQPAWWYIRSGQNEPVRIEASQTPLGRYEFRLDVAAQSVSPRMIQILPLDVSQNLAGQKVTLGAWIWSDRPVEIQGPALWSFENGRSFGRAFSVSTEPSFYVFSTKLPVRMLRAGVIFEPLKESVGDSISLYIDGFTLVAGDFSQAGVPIFSNSEGSTGEWGGLTIQNLIRNPSGERAWIGLRTWVDRLGPKIYPDYGREGLSLALYTLRDRAATGWFYWSSIGQLSRTFWGKFGWASVSLVGRHPYRLPAILTVLGLVGALIAAIRLKYDRAIAFLLGAAILIVWIATIFRGSSFVLDRAHFLPVARYVFPVILPTLLALAVGWLEIMRAIWKQLAVLKPWILGSFLLIFVGFDLYALFSIVNYFST